MSKTKHRNNKNKNPSKIKKSVTSQIDIVTSGILLFGFSITVLTQQNIEQTQRIIAYIALFISISLGIIAILPWDLRFLHNKLALSGLNMFAFIAWYFTFALKWLNGIINSTNIDQTIISFIGVLWLLAIIIILTNAFLNVTKNKPIPICWLHWLIPLVLLIKMIQIFVELNYLAGVIMLIFVILSTLISLHVWEPIGKLPLGASE